MTTVITFNDFRHLFPVHNGALAERLASASSGPHHTVGRFIAPGFSYFLRRLQRPTGAANVRPPFPHLLSTGWRVYTIHTHTEIVWFLVSSTPWPRGGETSKRIKRVISNCKHATSRQWTHLSYRMAREGLIFESRRQTEPFVHPFGYPLSVFCVSLYVF